MAPSKDVIHGGYVVPRAGGQLPEGLLMKMMAIVGSGGKALKFYVFGPGDPPWHFCLVCMTACCACACASESVLTGVVVVQSTISRATATAKI